jgi:phage tail sheath protein FI
MPEYLAPGVFIEEVSFRAKSIEGVPTSTTGFAGMPRFGPVCYAGGPTTCEPRLITSFTEFERVYGGLEPLRIGGVERICYLAHAAKAFFDNDGKRLYVSRVHTPPSTTDDGVARRTVAVAGTTATWHARWPGAFGNVLVECLPMRSKNVAYQPRDADGNPVGPIQARRAVAGSVVEVLPAGTAPRDQPRGDDPLLLGRLRVVEVDSEGLQTFRAQDDSLQALADGEVAQLVELTVRVTVDPERVDEYVGLSTAPGQKRYVGHILQADDPEDADGVVAFAWDPSAAAGSAFLPATLMQALIDNPNPRLEGGSDGLLVSAADLAGRAADPDDEDIKATGLHALGEIWDIAIVAAPDAGTLPDADQIAAAAGALIQHAEQLRYRIAVLDGQEGSSINEIRSFRGRFDSRHAAIYHPWIQIFDPVQPRVAGAPPRRLMLPPSGFVAGIYARTDVTRGVHKAPANEVVRGLTRFEANINTPRNEVLNPEGINALRFFEGRGHRVWGARTISSDPEWKYVNVRRLFNFIENSIDRGTQWAVFEPNDRRLWANIRRTVEDFLLVLWRDGALMGATPEQAYFVRCDRTTMTQNDIDNGRLICLIGIAPVKPAEFVIFRIGQWTADAA